MLLAALVVERRTPLHRGHQRRRIERLDDLQSCHFFGQVEQITPVAVGHGAQAGARILVERKFLAVMGFGALQQGFERRIVEPAQHQHLGARQQRAVEFEGRILRRGADQHNRAVFDHWQETVLLAAIEAVDFVDEEQRALPRLAAHARGIERLLQIGDAGKYRRQLLEMKLEGVAEKPRDRRFAGSGRSPQDDRMRAARATMRPIGPSGPSR